MLLEQFIFWTAVILLVYVHIGYPIILYGMARLFVRPWHRDSRYCPDITILVIACNEEHNVSERIINLLSLDYPAEKREIIIASDGSTDNTVALAKRYSSAGVRVVEFSTRSGKPAILNRLIPEATGDIVVLADMRQRFESAALNALIAPFADNNVGGVTGELILTGANRGSAAQGVGFYWKYEKFIRSQESLLDSTIGATGAIYAIRRGLFRKIRTDTLLDDVLIPMQITRQGYRIIHEPAARAYDNLNISAGNEYARKVRTIAGNFQLLVRESWLINPAANRIWIQTLSHKFLRLLSPLCLLIILCVNFKLLHLPLYQYLLAAQLIFYCVAIAGCWNEISAGKLPLVNVPYAFCLLNWATVMAFFSFISGRQTVTWKISRQ